MKVAICISGMPRGNMTRNLALLKSKLPYDVYLGSWTNHEIPNNLLVNGRYYYDAPNMHYHPIVDTDPISPKLETIKDKMSKGIMKSDYYERTLHHTKQILIHSYLLKDIPDDYDMIIRSRYDTVISTKVDLHKYLYKSYDENIAIGFGTRISRHKNFNILKEIPKIYPDGKNEKISNDWGWYLMDPLIMHPRKLFNHDLLNTLHNDKKLLPAENGWYQILSEPYNDSHLCVYGGAQIEKYL